MPFANLFQYLKNLGFNPIFPYLQFAYGAMIRNDFTATVAVENGFPVVKSATVAAKANAQRAKEFGINYIAISIFTAIGGAILYFIISAIVGF